MRKILKGFILIAVLINSIFAFNYSCLAADNAKIIEVLKNDTWIKTEICKYTTENKWESFFKPHFFIKDMNVDGEFEIIIELGEREGTSHADARSYLINFIDDKPVMTPLPSDFKGYNPKTGIIVTSAMFMGENTDEIIKLNSDGSTELISTILTTHNFAPYSIDVDGVLTEYNDSYELDAAYKNIIANYDLIKEEIKSYPLSSRYFQQALNDAIEESELTNAIKATPTTSKLLIDGKYVTPVAYNINGSNYFKLRDLAYILNGTGSQFDVGWDSDQKLITINTGVNYNAVGGEMTSSADSQNVSASNVEISVNGQSISLTAYNIGGNNYFMLRDLGEYLGFDVDWDSASSSIIVNTI